MSQHTTSNERVLAGFAYFLGLIPALVIWSLKKDESPHVRIHAMQAALYDACVSSLAMCLLAVQLTTIGFLMMSAWVVTNIIADTAAPDTPLVYLIISIGMILIIMGGISLIAVLVLGLKLLDLTAAGFTFAGRDWHIPVLANWAAKINQRDSLRSQRKK